MNYSNCLHYICFSKVTTVPAHEKCSIPAPGMGSAAVWRLAAGSIAPEHGLVEVRRRTMSQIQRSPPGTFTVQRKLAGEGSGLGPGAEAHAGF